MAWCPKCRNEYREGIEECADCHVPLVEELPPEEEDSGNEFDGDFEDWVKAHPEMLQKIKESQEEKNVEEEETPGIENRKLQVYRSSAQRAEEFKSSAWTLLIVGVAGLAGDNSDSFCRECEVSFLRCNVGSFRSVYCDWSQIF